MTSQLQNGIFRAEAEMAAQEARVQKWESWASWTSEEASENVCIIKDK